MKILAIGNSFSCDAMSFLKKIADSANMPLEAVNLFIGGCSFNTHKYNIRFAQNIVTRIGDLNVKKLI